MSGIPAALQTPILPDLLANGLTLVFCGTAAGAISAAKGEYYAHPQNKFWRVLRDVELIPRDFNSARWRELLEFGIGLTDIAKYASGMDHQLARGSLGADAIAGLKERIREVQPKILAFTSLTGGGKFLGTKAVVGEQSERIGATRIWILPSPSAAARRYWDEKIWRALAKEVRAASTGSA